MWRCGSFLLPVEHRCHVVAVLNVSTFSRTRSAPHEALDRAARMVEEGADIIEIGGESARPGALPVPADDEHAAVIPLVRALSEEFDVPVSVDTRKAEVAYGALDAGASIINDISSLADPSMPSLLAGSDCGVVLTHMRGTPETMQSMTEYDDVTKEVVDWFRGRGEFAEGTGIGRDRIAVDAGLGFAKNRHASLRLVRETHMLAQLGYPVMIAASRKSFIGRTLDQPPRKRLMGTLAVAAWSVAAGAALLRAHDIKETVRVVRMTEAILSQKAQGGDCPGDGIHGAGGGR